MDKSKDNPDILPELLTGGAVFNPVILSEASQSALLIRFRVFSARTFRCSCDVSLMGLRK